MKSVLVTDDQLDFCFECGAYGTEIHHCIKGNGRRKLADEDGLTVPLCRRCHEHLHSSKGHEMDMRYKRLAQRAYLATHTMDEWYERYGKSYI